MGTSNQRIGAKSNAQVGSDFELLAKEIIQKSMGIRLERNIKIEVGISDIKKIHAFDLGSKDKKTIIECKSHKWTSGSNVPSAKLTVWNEAMYYFLVAPEDFRKIMFVLHDYSDKHKKTLAQYYMHRYKHLIPDSVELWECNESLKQATLLHP